MAVDPTMSTRNLRKRKSPPVISDDPVAEAMKPLTDEERQNWKGWVELESDPVSPIVLSTTTWHDHSHVCFDTHSITGAIQLHLTPVRCSGCQDSRSLWTGRRMSVSNSVSCFSFLDKPSTNGHFRQPVYGMVFLFRYHDDDAEALEQAEKCPRNVWFANQVREQAHQVKRILSYRQTINNACATVALLNIVMNVPDLDLGENLGAFKEATQKLKPPYRGKRLGNNDFIRGIHNTFARSVSIFPANKAC